MNNTQYYPGFEHPASQLRKYIRAGDYFTIMLKNGIIIHHDAEHPDAFAEWLSAHHIEDIRKQDRKSLDKAPK